MPEVPNAPEVHLPLERGVSPGAPAPRPGAPAVPTGELPRDRQPVTLVEAIHEAGQRGVTRLASADHAAQAAMRVTTPDALAQTVERANARVVGAEPPRAYVVGDDGTIYNTVTRRAEYVAVRDRELPESPHPAPAPGASPPNPPPPQPAPAPGAVQPATLATLTNVTPGTAPRTIDLSAFQPVFTTEWGKSFPNGIEGTCYERGATITSDASGSLRAVNSGAGQNPQSGTFDPNLSVPAGQTVRGIIHTHPYSYADGYSASNPPPRNAPLSGADLGYMINKGHDVVVAVGADTQSMVLRTSATPAHVDFAAVRREFNEGVSNRQAAGASFEDAIRAQGVASATKYGLVYYEGKNGQLTRLN